ncbi:MAG TPA: hypothetical protein VMM54_00210 [Nitrospirota bacterium]|nr:hypothetical protein [Nitrospirota bacterium]
MLSFFISIELKLAELYSTLADRFPIEGAFFNNHHAEELKHAQWIEYFKDKVERGEVLFHENNTRTEAIKTFLTYAQKILDDAKADKLTLLMALSLSLSMEESLLERNLLDHFSADSPEFQDILKRLKDETRAHAAEIKKLRLKYSNLAAR